MDHVVVPTRFISARPTVIGAVSIDRTPMGTRLARAISDVRRQSTDKVTGCAPIKRTVISYDNQKLAVPLGGVNTSDARNSTRVTQPARRAAAARLYLNRLRGRNSVRRSGARIKYRHTIDRPQPSNRSPQVCARRHCRTSALRSDCMIVGPARTVAFRTLDRRACRAPPESHIRPVHRVPPAWNTRRMRGRCTHDQKRVNR